MTDLRPIPGFEGLYSITSDGTVYSHARLVAGRTVGGCFLHNMYMRNGYHAVRLAGGGHYMHRLLAAAWIANPESKSEVNHKNGIKTDNRLENLEWVTRSENLLHAYATGLKVSALRKLTEEQVIEIRSRLARGEYATDLAPEYGVGRKQIGKIKLGRTYQNVVAQ